MRPRARLREQPGERGERRERRHEELREGRAAARRWRDARLHLRPSAHAPFALIPHRSPRSAPGGHLRSRRLFGRLPRL